MAKIRSRLSDLELLPENDGKRYEIIDGELYVSRQPSLEHQIICAELTTDLGIWNAHTRSGVVAIAPGLIFADDDDVAPDVVWVSRERLKLILESDGKLHAAPELIIEVLSPGSADARRDREIKLGLYSRRAVREYWIVDWEKRQIEVYRRVDMGVQLVGTLTADEMLESPLLPGFTLRLGDLFARLPAI